MCFQATIESSSGTLPGKYSLAIPAERVGMVITAHRLCSHLPSSIAILRHVPPALGVETSLTHRLSLEEPETEELKSSPRTMVRDKDDGIDTTITGEKYRESELNHQRHRLYPPWTMLMVGK